MATAKKAIIYTRVSRDDTGEGKSNERQREDCEKLADLRGWDVVSVEEDVSISAYSGKTRPAWNRVVEAMREGSIDVVVAYHMDRITRTVRELTDIIALSRECGVGIATVNGDIDLTNDTGKMVATILGAVAEAEVERKGARQRRANQQRAAEGIPWSSGWRAFGYELDGTLIEPEAALVRQAAEDVLNGTSLREIVRRWKALGVTTPRSSKGVDGWTHNGVRSILLNPRNAGIATYQGEPIGKGNWQPILTYDTHTLLVAKMTDPARLKGKRSVGRGPRNLLTGLAVCATCGDPVQAGSGHKNVPVYQCKRWHISTPRPEADEIVRSAFAAAIALTRPGRILPIAERGVPSGLWEEINTLKERRDSLAMSFANGAIGRDAMELATKALNEQIVMLEARIEESAEEPSDPLSLRSESVRKFLDQSLAEQRKVLGGLATITLHPRGRGKRNVPMTQQVTMWLDVNGRHIPALAERADN